MGIIFNLMIKLVKKNLVITIPIKKVKELLNQTNGEPIQIEQPVESVEQTTGDITGCPECCAEPIPEVIPEDTMVSTSETEENNPVSE
jgi:hypothetical protein